VIINCTIEKNPWNATPKFAATSSLVDKAATEAAAKIALDKAVAEAKAATEAAAKIALDKAVAEAKAATEAAAKIALDKAVADNRATSDLLAKLQNDYSNLSANYTTYLNKYNEATTQIEFLQGVVKTLQAQVTELLKPKPETVVCTKGTTYKVVKGISPKCPAGYKKK
jgi:chromosome segregation ATPase